MWAEEIFTELSEEELALILDLAASHSRIADYKNLKGHSEETWTYVCSVLSDWKAGR